MFDVDSFTSELTSCKCRSKQSDPFFFRIQNQRVMLITACPSLQTVSGSLLTVRFVRQVLYALLGEEGVTEEGLSVLFAERGIYWTHFNKCYNEQFYRRSKKDGQYLLSTLPTECATIYIERELELLSNSLKLIIVMGDETCRKAAKYIDGFLCSKIDRENPIEVIDVDYLQKDDPKKYDILREKVAAALGRKVPVLPTDPSMLDTKKTRMQVRLDVELAALKALSAGLQNEKAHAIDESPISSRLDRMWIENVILPQKERQSILLSAWSAIESVMVAFFVDALNPVSQKAVAIRSRQWLNEAIQALRLGMSFDRNPEFRDLYSTICKSNPLVLMDRFVNYLTKGLARNQLSESHRRQWKVLYESLELMRQARHLLVHRGGFTPTAELFREDPAANAYENSLYELDKRLADLECDDLSGVGVLTNTLYLWTDAPEQFISLTEDLFDFIHVLDKHLNQ